ASGNPRALATGPHRRGHCARRRGIRVPRPCAAAARCVARVLAGDPDDVRDLRAAAPAGAARGVRHRRYPRAPVSRERLSAAVHSGARAQQLDRVARHSADVLEYKGGNAGAVSQGFEHGMAWDHHRARHRRIAALLDRAAARTTGSREDVPAVSWCMSQATPAVDPLFLSFQLALAGRYSIDRELGRGGMGIVYLAREVHLDRLVAIKLLPPTKAQAYRDRFLREARLAAKMSHPNIIPIHAVEDTGGFVYYVMAVVDGETLTQRVRTRGPLP